MVAVVAAVEAQVVVLSVRMVLQVVVRAKICADALALSYPSGVQVNRSSRRP